MVVAEKRDPCDYPKWALLVDACADYARLSGWRFVLTDFMGLDVPGRDKALHAAKLAAMPIALEYAERVRACAEAMATGADHPALVVEFQACQRLVASEAVYNSMIATINAVGLGEAAGGGESGDGGEDAAAYHDMSQPIEVIARRLLAYQASVDAVPELRDARQRRLLHASFIVEFGLEHGLAEMRDPTSEATLRDFLSRLGEWEGGKDAAGRESVRALVLESIPAGPAQGPLRRLSLEWFEANRGTAIVGGMIVGGVVGVVLAGAAVAVAAARRRH